MEGLGRLTLERGTVLPKLLRIKIVKEKRDRSQFFAFEK